MNNEMTQPIKPDDEVRYRCTCGEESVVPKERGGVCPKCDRPISPKTLQHDLALTMTIDSLHTDFTTQQATGIALGVSPDELVGKTLGHFEMVAPLGSGGMGQVYKALDKSLQRYVAVKVLRSGIGSSASLTSSYTEIDSLLQEAVAQARVTHPNIVTIYYVGKQDGNPFLAMELVHGEPLSKVIAERQLPFSDIGPIAIQMADALKFSYELDIIHGDIKPSNVMLLPNARVKLSDFGMARRASDVSAGKLGGTPNYIAPELLTGASPSVQSDMYALGVTLYELTFGQLPVALSGKTIPEWIESHEQAEIVYPTPWPEHLPDGWKRVLSCLLSRDPNDRYETYDELLEDLESVQPGSRVIARRAPRLIAAMIDYLVVLLLMAPMQMVLEATPLVAFFGDHAIVQFLVQLADFLPIAAYTVIVLFWRQSIGRALMHVRVVNEYGLKPAAKTMVARSFFRMCLIWATCSTIFFQRSDVFWVQIVSASVVLICLIYLVAATAFMLIYDQARSVHDLIFGTRVVLDTD